MSTITEVVEQFEQEIKSTLHTMANRNVTLQDKNMLKDLYAQLIETGQKLIKDETDENTQNYVEVVEQINTLMTQVNKYASKTPCINLSDTIVYRDNNNNRIAYNHSTRTTVKY